MATTIDKLDLSVHDMYALRIKMYEQVNNEYRLEQATSIPGQLYMANTIAQLTEIDMLFGIKPSAVPWAYFFPPTQFRKRRRFPFTFSRIAPSLRSTDEGGEEYNALFAVECRTNEEEKERQVIATCFKEVSKLNSWLGFVVGRIGQFLQG